MDVKVLTRHNPSNYGSLLQSIATLKVLKDLGYNAQIIDYHRKDDYGLSKIQVEAALKFSNLIKRIIYMVVRYPIEKFAECKFAKMRKAYLSITSPVYNRDDLKRLKADVFVTGSDQVWGPMVNGKFDSAFFLDFVDVSKRCVSIAASFGRTNFDADTQSVYQQLLSRYYKITVREDSAVRLLHSFENVHCIGQVLDPTLFLDKSQWLDELGLENTKENVQSPYILIYQIHNDPKLSIYAKKLAETKHCRLVRVNPFFHQTMRSGKFICCPDLKEFISLFMGAKLIVTDSFHGTCFSINLNKQFIEILPNNSTGTRNQSILTLTNLSHRIVRDFEDFSLADEKIDYKKVNAILDIEREKSLGLVKELFV
jgi:hypothetical protein